jgi:hypothetical protein
MSVTVKAALCVVATLLVPSARSDIVVDNEIIDPTEIFDFVYSEDSPVDWKTVNRTNYYCIYRNLWTSRDHPAHYPDTLARITNIPVYSSTKQYLPWLQTRGVTIGIENLAEVGSVSCWFVLRVCQTLTCRSYLAHCLKTE